jgi:phosphoribosylformylglycinamidine synthase
MVGLLPDAQRAARSGFAREGDAIALVGWNKTPSLDASELAKLRGEALPSELPEIDLPRVVGVLDAVRAAVRAGDLSSAHDIAEGGFLVAVAEACLAGGLGARLDAFPDPDAPGPEDPSWLPLLFGELGGGFVVSGTREALERLGEKVPLDIFGTVGGDALQISLGSGELNVSLEELRTAHGALAPLFP